MLDSCTEDPTTLFQSHSRSSNFLCMFSISGNNVQVRIGNEMSKPCNIIGRALIPIQMVAQFSLAPQDTMNTCIERHMANTFLLKRGRDKHITTTKWRWPA